MQFLPQESGDRDAVESVAAREPFDSFSVSKASVDGEVKVTGVRGPRDRVAEDL